MSAFRLAHARGAGWQDTARHCLAQLAQGEARANLGFVYVTDHLAQHAEDVLALLRAETGVSDWVGTVGIGVCASGIEYHDEAAMVVLLADLPPSSYRVFRSADELGASAAASRAFCALVHADYRVAGLAQAIDELAACTESGFLIGGVSSSRARTFQLAGSVIEHSLSGVAFASEVAVTTRLTQGCTPISAVHTITLCERNVIAQLDGRPALEVFKQDIAALGVDDLRQLAGQVFAAFPLEGCDTGDYLVRNLLGIDLRHGLIAVAEPVGPGRRVMFCRRDAAAAREDMQRMLRAIKQNLSAQPRGALYVSCLGRGAMTFGADSAELKLIEAALGPIPLAGFFANGEICHDRLYTYTGVLTVFI